MASTNPSQLFLLADHIKLSLLEAKRARQLKLPANTQDSTISRSLDQLSNGIEAIERQLSLNDDDPLRPTPERDQLDQLRKQYEDLSAQFHGESKGADTLKHANDPELEDDFVAAQQGGKSGAKAVRFRDDPSQDQDALHPYRDDPDEDDSPDQGALSNQQIHVYHQNVMAQQDEQLDQLGASIGRQRELTIAIGGELDEQVELLDDVDGRVDRHQGQLDGATKRLNTFARKAKQNWGVTTIAVLIIILILLIAITK